MRANVEPQVGGDLFVAAAAGVQLEAERADALGELELDEVMNVFGGRVIAHEGLAGFRGVIGGDRVERCADLLAFGVGENSGGEKGGRVRLAGGYFLSEKPPVKDDGALPAFEVGIERFAKAAGPHFPGLLFVRHCFVCLVVIRLC